MIWSLGESQNKFCKFDHVIFANSTMSLRESLRLWQSNKFQSAGTRLPRRFAPRNDKNSSFGTSGMRIPFLRMTSIIDEGDKQLQNRYS